MNCPDCSGAMWDNRADKKNPKSPDFKCKNKQCDKAVWEKKADAAPATNGNGHAPNGNGAAHGSRPLGPLYNECMEFAKAAAMHHFGKDVAPDVVVAATATLFIQAVKDGAPIRPKPAPRPVAPPPPPPPPEPVYDPYQDERDLPF